MRKEIHTEGPPMSATTLGMILLAVAIIETVLISLIGWFKGRPILILAGILSGVVTAAIGAAFMLGKIPLS